MNENEKKTCNQEENQNEFVITPVENSLAFKVGLLFSEELNYITIKSKNVNVEFVPENDEWWISPEEHPEKWELYADRDTFNWEERRKIRVAACQWWKEHVFVGKQIDCLSKGFYKLKQCEVKNIYAGAEVVLDNSKVDTMRFNSRVIEMRGNSRVNIMQQNSSIGRMMNDSRVGMMLKDSQVDCAMDNSKIGTMSDSSIVYEASGNSRIYQMCDNSRIYDIWDNSRVDVMQNNSRIETMAGSSRVGLMFGNSQICKTKDNSLVEVMRGNSQVVEVTDESQIGKMYENSIAIKFEVLSDKYILLPMDNKCIYQHKVEKDNKIEFLIEST